MQSKGLSRVFSNIFSINNVNEDEKYMTFTASFSSTNLKKLITVGPKAPGDWQWPPSLSEARDEVTAAVSSSFQTFWTVNHSKKI